MKNIRTWTPAVLAMVALAGCGTFPTGAVAQRVNPSNCTAVADATEVEDDPYQNKRTSEAPLVRESHEGLRSKYYYLVRIETPNEDRTMLTTFIHMSARPDFRKRQRTPWAA